MKAISIVNKTSKKTEWKTFPSSAERLVAYLKMKEEASRTGCGGMCDCFCDRGNSFESCWATVSLVENLRMEDQ
jgi:hypothetical protein